MILIFYFALNVISIILFISLKKKLHVLESFVYWMLSSYLYQNFSAICYMNFKTLYIPDNLQNELSHFLNRTILFPLIMVTFLHFFLTVSSRLKKLIVMITFLFILLGFEWLADSFGVLIHRNWRTWWSFTYWIVTLLVLISFMKIFRKLLYKGGQIS